ncbi:MAG: HAMP domain-containing protein [Candidatus Latescibacteria bacterium]|nr:HAMP domain-containing protein [Candidatus Latescibacterota bacterium]NIM64412.1 HAMP domain-containing protein [Candidatus Latescibacterota bacterium]NIO00566.1 HAMP domain-containing protein [Candidatus Latescibacterota bacterium]NIO26966.1 HAMP domain-containing protein [Candidatus Latescibacterota bacterium]NIO56043.1 HAMP domain-containing protein [Candidatus Latescibacterota bacterium]
MSIRIRLVVMCLVFALLPAIPSSLLVQSLLEKSFNVGLSETIEEALQSGIVISRERLEQIRMTFEKKASRVISKFTPSAVDSSTVATVLSRDPEFSGELDGFILFGAGQRTIDDSKRPDLPEEPGAFAGHPVFLQLTDRNEIIHRRPAIPSPELSFYETADRSVQFALWKPRGSSKIEMDRNDASWSPSPPGSRPSSNQSDGDLLILYSRTDPEFLAQADRLLAGRQIFAQLRLERGWLSRSFFYPFVIIYAAILFLSLGFALLMAERLASPIRRLVHGTKVVAEGNWDYRLETKTGGEVGRLVEAFNGMVSRLEDQRRRLIDMEKMAAWRDLARRLAHEIKNPLLPIRLTVEELKDQYGGGDDRYHELLTESVRVIGDELNSLQRLVKEFSSFAKLPEISPSMASMEQLVADVAKLYPQISIDIAADPELPEFRFDPDHMRRVLVNLFDNSVTALEATKGGRIRITISKTGEDAVLVFSDNGTGISPEHLPKIFDPYFTSRREGMGLGLAMVKNIVLLHGGSIDVESSEGKGTTFIIRIPITGPEDGSERTPEYE